MKRAWSGLLLGISTLPAMAATCEHSSLPTMITVWRE
jgi:enterochelin esterase family protein